MSKKKFRLKNLDIAEVSLVDKPAIKRQFMVIKDMEAGMADESEDQVDPTEESEESFIDKLASKLSHYMNKSDDPVEEKDEDMADEEMVSKSDISELIKAAEDRVSKAFEERISSVESENTSLRKEALKQQCREHVKAHDWPGSVDDNVDLMEKMASHLPEEDFKAWMEREDTRATEIGKSELFTEIGTHLSSTSGSVSKDATAKIEKARKEGKTYDELLAEVDPTEYSKAMKEHEQEIFRSLGGN